MRLAYWFALSLAAVGACAADDAVDGELAIDGVADPAGKADDATLTITEVTNVNISSTRRHEGGTFVMTSKQAWYRKMGTATPSSIDFSKDWVVFYGMGTRNTGGYSAEVTGVRYDAADRE